MGESFFENIIIMKAGTHADESLDRILVRKTREVSGAGFCLWGYGGSSCHPIRQVQIHAQRAASRVKCLFVRTLSNPASRPVIQASTLLTAFNGRHFQLTML